MPIHSGPRPTLYRVSGSPEFGPRPPVLGVGETPSLALVSPGPLATPLMHTCWGGALTLDS